MKDQFLAVGKVRDAHGLKGELFVVLHSKSADWLSLLTNFNLVTKPLTKSVSNSMEEPMIREQFQVIRAKPHKAGLIIRTNEINDRTKAESYKGAVFEIPMELLRSKEGEIIFLREIEGFDVFDGLEKLGPIVGFRSNGAQDLLSVLFGDKEILVPLVPDFIEFLDFKNRKLQMKLPVGLSIP